MFPYFNGIKKWHEPIILPIDKDWNLNKEIEGDYLLLPN
jgi:hypothetical protein